MARDVLQAGLRRWPESPLLHERMRNSILARADADALAAQYDKLLADNPAPSLRWFAGYAALVRAEGQRRKAGHPSALAA